MFTWHNIVIYPLLFALIISGCQDAGRGSDGYVFEEKEYTKLNPEIEFVLIPNQKEFDKLQQQYAPNADGLQAFARLFPSVNKCIIYIKDPEWTYAPEFIGHEVTHCLFGRWHEKRNAKDAKAGNR